MKFDKIFKILNVFIILFVALIPVSFSLSIESDRPNMKITLNKLHRINVDVQNIVIENDEFKSPVEFKDKEQMLLSIVRIKESPSEGDFEQFIDYTAGADVSIDLVPGDYFIDGQFILNDEVVIPERVDTYCEGLTGGWEKTGSSFAGSAVVSAAMAAAFLGPAGWVVAGVLGAISIASLFFDEEDCMLGTKKEIPVDAVEMNPAILGGVTGNITIGDNIYSKDKLTFYTFSIPPPQAVEELIIISLLGDISAEHPYKIQPR